MPDHTLPADVLFLVFSQLTSPVTLKRPAFYDDLRSASLVCKAWTLVAQKLLWKAVYLDGGDEQMKDFLTVEAKGKTKELVLHDNTPEDTEKQAWSVDILLAILKRCDLQHLEVRRPHRAYQSSANPQSTLLSIGSGPPFRGFTYELLLSCIAQECQQGRLPLLTSLAVQSSHDLPSRGGFLTRQLRHFSVETVYQSDDAMTLAMGALFSAVDQSSSLRQFLVICTSLDSLSIGSLGAHDLYQAFPPSLTTVRIGKVAEQIEDVFLEVLLSALPRLPKITLLRLGDWDRLVEVGEEEHVSAVEQACEAQGVELVKG
ncbi:hypothetical protein JCM10213_000078 [Rhodosporidiobolus nylandii]